MSGFNRGAEADISMSPGVRWGPSILPGQDITREDIWNVTSMSYGKVYRTEMTGEFIHIILEDVAITFLTQILITNRVETWFVLVVWDTE